MHGVPRNGDNLNRPDLSIGLILPLNVLTFHMMDPQELSNWKLLAESMESDGATDSWFYRRARAIADGKPDPMPNISELMPNSDVDHGS